MSEFFAELLEFIGRWHPVFVHLPIGMLIFAFVMSVLKRFARARYYLPAIRLGLAIGTVAAVFAALTGFLLARNGGYETGTLTLHQTLGIAVAVLGFVIFLLYRETKKTPKWLLGVQKQRFWLLSATIFLLGLTGHYGGTLTHGKGYFTDALPTAIKNTFGIAASADEVLIVENVQEAAVYAEIVQPILRQRCQSCHGEKKSEGGLALHSMEALKKGGDSGLPTITAGDTLKSELHARLVLPEGHEGRMPPKGRKPIPTDHIRLIAWWIAQGADFVKKAKDLAQSEDVQQVLQRLESGEQIGQTEVLYADLPTPPPLPAEKVKQWEAKGIKIMPVALGSDFVFVNAINYPAFSDGDLEELLAIKDNVVQLKLGHTALSDQGMAHLPAFSLLHRLHLEHTAVTDAGLAHLEGLKHLRYVNLVGSKVTENGLEHLASVQSLENAYAWKTEISPEADPQALAGHVRLDTGNYTVPLLPKDTVIY